MSQSLILYSHTTCADWLFLPSMQGVCVMTELGFAGVFQQKIAGYRGAVGRKTKSAIIKHDEFYLLCQLVQYTFSISVDGSQYGYNQ